MKSIKTLYEENKEKIKVLGCVVGVAVISTVAYKLNKRFVVVDRNVYSSLVWKPCGTFMNLERAKEILDLNADNTERFAIFKNGIKPDDYSCIIVSGNVLTHK